MAETFRLRIYNKLPQIYAYMCTPIDILLLVADTLVRPPQKKTLKVESGK